MPLYEYGCSGCQKVTEVIQKFSDPPLTTCPECGGALTKLMSLNAFHLKGTGFYNTDYKKKPAATGGGDSSGGAAGSGGTGTPSSGAAGGSDKA